MQVTYVTVLISCMQ